MNEGNARDVAVRILQMRERGEDFIENIAERELAVAKLSAQDRGLAVELAYGCVRRQSTLDFLLEQKTQGRQQKPTLRILLRLGLYQLFFLDRIPDHAAVHETVEMAKRLGFGPQAGFVNAILRGYIRERAEADAALADLEKSRPWIALSHPEWLWARWSKRWGAESVRALMQLNNEPPGVFARVNTLRATHDELATRWQAEGVEFRGCQFEWAPLVFELLKHPPLATLDSFKAGMFYLQDPSTLLAPRELEARAGEAILDLCAAPGGKTTYLAQLTSNQATIWAEDVQPARLTLVAENAERLGAKINLGPAPGELRFDRILIDAPCSNTGVLRRRVDLRWRLKESEIAKLARLQLGLLEQAARRLTPGGTIVYSTCSLEPEENSEVIREFLEARPEFKLEFGRELLPFRDRTDGAFVARLRNV
jgi:16S rRNA (cytosine967-C5)-methyltransferase